MAVAVMGRRQPRRRRPVGTRTENGSANVRVTWWSDHPVSETSAATAVCALRLNTCTTKEA